MRLTKVRQNIGLRSAEKIAKIKTKVLQLRNDILQQKVISPERVQIISNKFFHVS